MFCVEKWIDGGWHIVGQYHTRKQANTIAADYRRRGEKVRVTSEE